MELSEALRTAVGLILVAVCWGLTNPFLKRGSKGLDEVKAESNAWGAQALAEYKFLFSRWQYVVPLILNLSGSLVYYYTLGQSELSMVVPVANSLTLLFTILGGHFLGERISGKETWIGMALIGCGVTLCLISK